MDGTSSLDEPTGTRKYSMAAPSAGDRAAKRERKTNDMIDRNLQRAMRTGPSQQRVAAGIAYQERSRTPGYQPGGGIQSAEGNRNRDRQTADNFTKEGLRLQGKENSADVVAGQADAANKNVGVATADGGTNSNIGTSAADGGNSKIGTSKADASGRVTMEKRNPASGALGDGSGSSAAKPLLPVGSKSPFAGMDEKPEGLNARELNDWDRTYDKSDSRAGTLGEPEGAEWVDIGKGAPPPATTPPATQGGAGNGKPAVPEWQQKRTAALEALRGKFTKQDAANALAKELEPKGIDPKYQDSGLSPEDDAARAAFLEKITNENATENAVAKEDADYLEKAKAVSARATELTKQARENSDQEDYVASALRGEDPPEDQVLAKSTENKPSPTKEAAPQDPRLSQNLWDKASPAEKATLEALKDESYSNAWWKTSGATGRSTWTSDTSDLEAAKAYGKTPAEYHKMQEQAVQGELRAAARQDMIKYSLARGVDLTPLASKDPEFLKQWDTAKQSHESSKRIANRQQESSQLVSSNDKPL